MSSPQLDGRGELFGPLGFIRVSKVSWAIERACAARWGGVPSCCEMTVYGHLRSCSLLTALGVSALAVRAFLVTALAALLLVWVWAVGCTDRGLMLLVPVLLVVNQALDAFFLSLESWSRTSSVWHAVRAMETVRCEIDRCVFADARGLPAPDTDGGSVSTSDCDESK